MLTHAVALDTVEVPEQIQGAWSLLILGDLDPSAPHHAHRRAATPTRSPTLL